MENGTAKIPIFFRWQNYIFQTNQGVEEEQKSFVDQGKVLLEASSCPTDCPFYYLLKKLFIYVHVLYYYNHFRKQVLKEYEEDQIGPLDDEDICGFLSTSSKRVTDLLDGEEHVEE